MSDERNPGLTGTRDLLRMVALDLKNQAEERANYTRGTEHEIIMRLYAKATFWATMALSAPEGDAPVPATPEPTPEPQEDAQSPSQTYTYQGVTYDLSASYTDSDDDVWSFMPQRRDCGMPEMKHYASIDTLASVVEDFGPLDIIGTPPPYEGLTCDECGARHDPEGI